MTRRDFLRRSGQLAVSVAVGSRVAARQKVPPALDLSRLRPFVSPLPIPPTLKATSVKSTGATHTPVYQLPMRQVETRLHPDLPPTRFWSFGSTFPGPTIEARKGQPIWIDWINELPSRHFLPIDHTIHGAGHDVPETRAVVHVHGARVKPEDDGHPESWTTPGHTSSFFYPNQQDATTLWYHDHTMGINRLNVYAGLVGAYLIRDDEEDAIGLPSGARDIPLIFCDRMLDSSAQLVYPVSDDPDAPWVPGVFGEAMLVNGALFPCLDVEPALYRFRMINACNGTFLRLSAGEAVPLTQIGGDQGLLERPAPATLLMLAPAERADVLVDFSAHAGRAITLVTAGQPVMQYRVRRTAAGSTPSHVPVLSRRIARLAESMAVRTRTHALDEVNDAVMQPMRMLINNASWHDPVTERATLDSIEVWELVNLTDDSHPIHLHLVRFQILDRRIVDKFEYRTHGRVRYVAPAMPPTPGESGWKDTVRVDSGTVTRIIIKFEGYTGRYMWHCHLLEHGDNEMMRPLEIVPARAGG
jgi:spore coat protein A, manganese oxidase